MKSWTEQLLHTEKLFGYLLTKNDNSSDIVSKLIDFKKDDINNKYAVYKDSGLPTLIKL